MKNTLIAVASLTLLLAACASDDNKNTSGDGGITTDSAAMGGGGTSGTGAGACSSISCYVASQNTCDDYGMATPTQCSDVPVACTNNAGVLAKPAGCPTAGFTAKCTMPGPGGYVLRFYGTRGDNNDMNFCTGIAMGTWSTTF
jgi:hypothetical protein